MCIYPIRLTCPFCDASEEKQTKCSLIIRTMAAGIGAIALLMGVLILCDIPGLSTLGTTEGSLFSALGVLVLLTSAFLKCSKECDWQGSEHFTLISKKTPHSLWDIRGDKPIDALFIFEYLSGLEEQNPMLKTPKWIAEINDNENTVMETVMELLNNQENTDAEAFAFTLYLSGSGWKHHTLVYIDCIKRTVEFYDNVVQSANHQKVTNTLSEVEKILSQRKPGDFPFKLECKITQPVLGNAHDCGAWAMYFVENRLKDPNIDFNGITPSEGKKMMRNHRELVTQRLVKRQELIVERTLSSRTKKNPETL